MKKVLLILMLCSAAIVRASCSVDAEEALSLLKDQATIALVCMNSGGDLSECAKEFSDNTGLYGTTFARMYDMISVNHSRVQYKLDADDFVLTNRNARGDFSLQKILDFDNPEYVMTRYPRYAKLIELIAANKFDGN